MTYSQAGGGLNRKQIKTVGNPVQTVCPVKVTGKPVQTDAQLKLLVIQFKRMSS